MKKIRAKMIGRYDKIDWNEEKSMTQMQFEQDCSIPLQMRLHRDKILGREQMDDFGKYADFSDVESAVDYQIKMQNAADQFMTIKPEVRAFFRNSPEAFVDWLRLATKTVPQGDLMEDGSRKMLTDEQKREKIAIESAHEFGVKNKLLKKKDLQEEVKVGAPREKAQEPLYRKVGDKYEPVVP